MPELPEVETIVNDLNKYLAGVTITSFEEVNILAGRKNTLTNLPDGEMEKKLKGRKILSVSRRAKTLVFLLDKDVLLIHLKMTGQLVFKHCDINKCEAIVGGHPIVGVGNELPNKFTRAICIFKDGSRLYFNDVRRFGWIRLYSISEWQDLESKIGLEPLGKEFTLDFFLSMLSRKRNSTIKQAILEQKYLVGIGNIYADECLFTASIKPQRQVLSLTDVEIKKLWLVIPKILRLAIKHRGTSFNDYRDAHGDKGNFVKLLKVYGRATQPCKKCGHPLLKTRIGGRGTVWCDYCQK